MWFAFYDLVGYCDWWVGGFRVLLGWFDYLNAKFPELLWVICVSLKIELSGKKVGLCFCWILGFISCDPGLWVYVWCLRVVCGFGDLLVGMGGFSCSFCRFVVWALWDASFM